MLAGALALAGCAGGLVISGLPLPSDAANSFVLYAAAIGDVPLVVRGNPSELPDGDLNELVLANLRLPAHLQPATFTLHPDPGLPHALRLVLVFNPEPAHLPGKNICRNPDGVASSAPALLVRVKMTFCNADEAVAENTGRTLLPEVTARQFGLLLQQTINGLFPPRELDLDDCLFRRRCP